MKKGKLLAKTPLRIKFPWKCICKWKRLEGTNRRFKIRNEYWPSRNGMSIKSLNLLSAEKFAFDLWFLFFFFQIIFRQFFATITFPCFFNISTQNTFNDSTKLKQFHLCEWKYFSALNRSFLSFFYFSFRF